MAIYTQVHNSRPSSVTLILATTAQSFELRQLVLALPKNFEGCLLINFKGDTDARRQLQIQIQLDTQLRSVIAAKSISLTAGQIILLDPAKRYQLNARDQLLQIDRPEGDALLHIAESLGKYFGAHTSLIPMEIGDRHQLLRAAFEIRQHRGQILLPKELERSDPAFSARLHEATQTTGFLETRELANAIQQHRSTERQAFVTKPLIERQIFERILELLNDHQQSDLRRYREPSLIKRLEHRLEQLGESCVDTYYLKLQSDRDELSRLYEDLLIGTTSFFRQPTAFDDLYEILLDYLQSGKDSLRVWSAGCSTGEETYSLAMLADRLVEQIGRPIRVSIYGTDLSRRALSRAREGLYTSKSVKDIPAYYLPKDLKRVGERYDIASSIKSSILFNRHDLLTYPTLSEFDLVVCRNLLIYFKADTQDELIKRFHSVLKPGGLLMLGRSESTGTSRSLFVAKVPSSRIYKALNFSPLNKR